MTQGERIRIARTRAGLTQAQLGEAVGLKKSTIANYEKGYREIAGGILGNIAKATGTPVSFFYESEGQPTTEDELSKSAAMVIRLFRQIPEENLPLATELVQGILTSLIKHLQAPAEKQSDAPQELDRYTSP